LEISDVGNVIRIIVTAARAPLSASAQVHRVSDDATQYGIGARAYFGTR